MSGLKIALWSLWAPVRALAEAADQRRFVWPLLLVTLVSVGFGALAVERVDFASPADDELVKTPDYAKMTPHEREDKIAQAVKIGVVGTFAKGALWPAFSALASAFMLWLGFKVAGGKPGFVATFAVVAHSLLPDAVKLLASLPALLTRAASLSALELERLLPSNLGALLAETTKANQLALLSSVDLFALWSLAMLAVGMVHVARVTGLRSTVVVTVLWASFVLVFRFALPSLIPAS